MNKYFINKPIKSDYCIVSEGRFYPFFRFENGLIGKAKNGRTIGINKNNEITDIATGFMVKENDFEKYLNAKNDLFKELENVKNLFFKQWENPLFIGGSNEYI